MSSPKTLDEAKAHRYRRWAASPEGTAYRPTLCAAIVADTGRSPLSHQCWKKRQAESIFCKQHEKANR